MPPAEQESLSFEFKKGMFFTGMGVSETLKIVTVIGARPQFIKAAAIRRTISEFNKGKSRIGELWVHTGQHYDYLMNKVFFEELGLPKPDYHLGVGSGFHGSQTGMMLGKIETVLQKEKPKVVLVYGDTNTTLAGALAAAKLNIPVAHVEAGLRSYNRVMPEEVNRLLTDHLSTFLFCPTAQAVRNLLKEGIKEGGTRIVRNVGDVMYDSILYYSKLTEKKSTILKDLGLVSSDRPPIPHSPLRHAPHRVHGRPETYMVQGELRAPIYYLATLHRAENTDNPKRLKSILRAMDEIGENTPILLPLHPRTKKMVKVYHLLSQFKNIKYIEPVSYFDMLKLEKNAKAILTDSGGVQKEAYWFRVPCVTLREETEWVETVKSGWNALVGADPKKIVQEINSLGMRRSSKREMEIFGDGKASEKIVQILIRYLG